MTRFIRITLATAAMALAAAGASALEPRTGVKLRALDKITGNSTDLTAKVGDTLKFGHLTVTVRACYASPPEDTPESAAFLEIHAIAPVKKEGVKNDTSGKVAHGPPPGPDGLLFSGWMFASSPGLSALEHPTYDVWVISCSAAAPEQSPPASPN
jgi:hypothetical protein